MAFQHVSREQLAGVYNASIERGYADPEMRVALFGGVNRGYVAGLPALRRPDAQLLTDLHNLNQERRIVDGTIPFELWLGNAVMLGAPLGDIEAFDAALETLRAQAAEEPETLADAVVAAERTQRPALSAALEAFVETVGEVDADPADSAPAQTTPSEIDETRRFNAFMLGLNFWGCAYASEQELASDRAQGLAVDLSEYVRFFRVALEGLAIDSEAIVATESLAQMALEVGKRLRIHRGLTVFRAYRAAAWVVGALVTDSDERRDEYLQSLRRDERPRAVDDELIAQLAAHVAKDDRRDAVAFVFEVVMGGAGGPLPNRRLDEAPTPAEQRRSVDAYQLGFELGDLGAGPLDAEAVEAQLVRLAGHVDRFEAALIRSSFDRPALHRLHDRPADTFLRLQIHCGRRVELSFRLGFYGALYARATDAFGRALALAQLEIAATALGIGPALIQSIEGGEPADIQQLIRSQLATSKPAWLQLLPLSLIAIASIALAIFLIPPPDDGPSDVVPDAAAPDVSALDAAEPQPDLAERDVPEPDLTAPDVDPPDEGRPDRRIVDIRRVDIIEAECGDGIVAGSEECDDGRESRRCDADCTRRVCGDGYVNRVGREQCDDGNTESHDGCSNRCQLETSRRAECGDGVLTEPEECDHGGRENARCDADCTVPRCGDGHVNRAARESCDDGNRESGDGCSERCLLEVNRPLLPVRDIGF